MSLKNWLSKIQLRKAMRKANSAASSTTGLNGVSRWAADFPRHLEKAQAWLRQKGGMQQYVVPTTLLFSAWFLSNVTALLLENFIPAPPPPAIRLGGPSALAVRPGPEAFEAIISRNLFNSQGLIPGESEGPGPGRKNPLDDPPVKTTLSLDLLGTVILEDHARSIATLSDRNANLIYPVQIEDEIPGKIRVTKIEAYKVIFVNLQANRLEYVDLPEAKDSLPHQILSRPTAKTGGSPGIKDMGSNRYEVRRTEIDKALSNMAEVLTQARAVPNVVNGQQKGFKLFQIVPGSIYETLGLKNDDVLLGLNGEMINDPAKAIQIMNDFKTLNHVELKVQRGGKEQDFIYDVN